jgi:hypothetical protein
LGTQRPVAEHRNVPPNAITEIRHKSTFLSPQTRALVPKHKPSNPRVVFELSPHEEWHRNSALLPANPHPYGGRDPS